MRRPRILQSKILPQGQFSWPEEVQSNGVPARLVLRGGGLSSCRKPPLAARGAAIHPKECRTIGVFRFLRKATKGAAFGIRNPLKRVHRNFCLAHQYRAITAAAGRTGPWRRSLRRQRPGGPAARSGASPAHPYTGAWRSGPPARVRPGRTHGSGPAGRSGPGGAGRSR